MSDQSESVTNLPSVILDYFAAANDGHADAATACFTATARVHDENMDHLGHDAIREWVADTTRLFQPKTELLRAVDTNGTVVATARVSGNFPGSPVELNFTFTLTAEKISHLFIE